MGNCSSGATGGCCERKDMQDLDAGLPAPEPPGLHGSSFEADSFGEKWQSPERTKEPERTGGNAEPTKDNASNLEEESIPGTTFANVTYQDSSSYAGQIKDGKRHGAGVWTTCNNKGDGQDNELDSKYEGQWRDDQQDGHGRQNWSDGRMYEGQFKGGKFEGKGRMEWHTSQGLMLYEGTYQDDLKHGAGRFAWPDGRTYEGEWVNGKRCGSALYINSDGEKRRGIWKDDRLECWLE